MTKQKLIAGKEYVVFNVYDETIKKLTYLKKNRIPVSLNDDKEDIERKSQQNVFHFTNGEKNILDKDHPYMISCDLEMWKNSEAMRNWRKILNGSRTHVFLKSDEYNISIRLEKEPGCKPVCYFTLQYKESISDEDCISCISSEKEITNEFVHIDNFIDVLIKLFS